METQEIRDDVTLQDDVETDLKFCIGAVNLIMWQGPEADMSPEILQPVLHDVEKRLYETQTAVRSLCKRLSAFTTKEKEKADAMAEEARKNRPISDDEIEAVRGVVRDMEKRQAEQTHKANEVHDRIMADPEKFELAHWFFNLPEKEQHEVYNAIRKGRS